MSKTKEKRTGLPLMLIVFIFIIAALVFITLIWNFVLKNSLPDSGLKETASVEPLADMDEDTKEVAFSINGFTYTAGIPGESAGELSGDVRHFKDGTIDVFIGPETDNTGDGAVTSLLFNSLGEDCSYTEVKSGNGFNGQNFFIYSAGKASAGQQAYTVLSYINGNGASGLVFSVLSQENDAEGALLLLQKITGTLSVAGSGNSAWNGNVNNDSVSSQGGISASGENDSEESTDYTKQYLPSEINPTVVKAGRADENGESAITATYTIDKSQSTEKQVFFLKFTNTKLDAPYAELISPSGKYYEPESRNKEKMGYVYFVVNDPEFGEWKANFDTAEYGGYMADVEDYDSFQVKLNPAYIVDGELVPKGETEPEATDESGVTTGAAVQEEGN